MGEKRAYQKTDKHAHARTKPSDNTAAPKNTSKPLISCLNVIMYFMSLREGSEEKNSVMVQMRGRNNVFNQYLLDHAPPLKYT